MAPVMVESARRNGVAVAQVRAHPEPVDILAGEPSVTVEGVDNPYISAYQVTCHILPLNEAAGASSMQK